MICRPMWPFLLMYGSHDMRHTSFSQFDGGQRDPREMERHIYHNPYDHVLSIARISVHVIIFHITITFIIFLQFHLFT